MPEEKLIVLCPNNSDYFFSKEKSIYPVYKNGNTTLNTNIRRFSKFCFPNLEKLIWDNWIEKLSETEKIVIFDAAYEIGLENKILSINPDIEIYLFSWNPINCERMYERVNKFYKKANVFCTCPTDCEKNSLHFCQIPYSQKWADYIRQQKVESKKKAVWVGQNKGRYQQLVQLKKALEFADVEADIRIVGGEKNEFQVDHTIDYYNYSKMISESKIILDINQSTQSGLTLRVPESIFFEKKIITNNPLVEKFDFYNSNNILVVDTQRLDVEEIKEFVDLPFVPYSKGVKSEFDFEFWLKNFS